MREPLHDAADPTLGAADGTGRDGWATLDDGVRLHYVERGAGPLVVLLHGFPQYWGAWRGVMPPLAAAGYRVVAPDLRGYNLSDRPREVRAYRLSRLARDVTSLIEALGERRAHVVGHDWGGAIAWRLGARHRGSLRRLAVINAPHPAALREVALRTTQLLHSWYVVAFQLPWLPERLLRARDFAPLLQLMRHGTVRRGAFGAEEIARHRLALGRPGALTAALNYYRAVLRGRGARVARPDERETAPREAAPARMRVPTLVLWGMRDRHLHPALSEGLERWIDEVRVVRLPDVSHWVMQEEPERVATELARFLRDG